MTRWSFWLALLIALAPAGIAAACPSCKDSIPNSASEAAAGVPSGFNWSVYYMLAGVFGVGAFVIRMIVREVRRSDGGPPAMP